MAHAQIPQLDASSTPAAMATALGEAGAVVLTDVLPEDARGQLRAELAPQLEAAWLLTEDDPAAFYPANTRRLPALVTRSQGARGLVTNTRLLAACDHFLLPNCSRYQLHVTTALAIGPGAREQVLHREDDSYPFFPVPRPHLVVASMWAVTEFTADNGATLIVPGSHRWEAGRKAQPAEVVSAVMPAGAVLIWLGGTLHGAGANRTSSNWRHGVFVSYSLGWLRQEENQYLDVPPHVAADLDDDLRALVGYKPHGGLGFYDPRIARKYPQRDVSAH